MLQNITTFFLSPDDSTPPTVDNGCVVHPAMLDPG